MRDDLAMRAPDRARFNAAVELCPDALAHRCITGVGELGFPLLKTGWTVGQQPPLLEGAPASAAWQSILAEQQG